MNWYIVIFTEDDDPWHPGAIRYIGYDIVQEKDVYNAKARAIKQREKITGNLYNLKIYDTIDCGENEPKEV